MFDLFEEHFDHLDLAKHFLEMVCSLNNSTSIYKVYLLHLHQPHLNKLYSFRFFSASQSHFEQRNLNVSLFKVTATFPLIAALILFACFNSNSNNLSFCLTKSITMCFVHLAQMSAIAQTDSIEFY